MQMVEKARLNAKAEIEHSAEEAIRVIAQAEGASSARIALAANDALKVVANAASEAVKVNSARTSDDHDLLIRIDTQMKGLKDDIKDLKDGTSITIADHEKRISCLEIAKGETKGASGGMRAMWGWVAFAILSIISIAAVVVPLINK